MGDKLTSIESCAFQHCCSLKSINIPHSVKCLYDKCFDGCKALKTIDVPIGAARFGYNFGDKCFDSHIDVVYFKPDVNCLFNSGNDTNIFAAADPELKQMDDIHNGIREFCKSHFSCESGDSKTILIPTGMEIVRNKNCLSTSGVYWNFTGTPGEDMIMIKIKENELKAFLIPNYRQITGMGLDTGILRFRHNGSAL
jgi:hypothetical protein